jgi:putative membrane protein
MNQRMKTKFFILPLATVLLFFNLSALAQAAEPELSEQGALQAESGFGATSRSGKVEKAEHIIEVLNVVNSNQINAANEALQRSRNPAVRSFAAKMRAEHSANQQRMNVIAQRLLGLRPAPSTLSNLLQRRGRIELNQLASSSPQRFDSAYMQAMIRDHRNTLSIIDNILLPKAKRPMLVQHLRSTRSAVEDHLHLAEQIASGLK